MTALWRHDGSDWSLLSPSAFPAEADLHTLVADAPHVLPLAEADRLVVVGREVSLGGGYADLIAVEPAGRLVVIEVKLAKNSEARRAVVAQALAYAAFLHGLDRETLERDVLGNDLRRRGYVTLTEAAASDDQEDSFDVEAFERALEDNLATGKFRVVLVLDEAPPELVRLVGYLQAVAGELLIDLITVSAYEVNGSRIIVPQRVDVEARPKDAPSPAARTTSRGYLSEGAEDFITAIKRAPTPAQVDLRRLADWAIALEAEGLVRLKTFQGKGRWTLLPRLPTDDVGLVTIWNDNGAYLSVWRSVFERRAPDSIDRVERVIGARIGNGNTIRNVSDEALEAFTAAYREAAANLRDG